MRLYFKSAIFSAIVVLILSAVLLGVRLAQVGTELTLVGAEDSVLWKVAAASLLIFFYNLFRDPIERVLGLIPKPTLSAGIRDISQRQFVQRIVWCFLIAAALIFPFIGSRSQIDLATLVLIYVMACSTLAMSVSMRSVRTPTPCWPCTLAWAFGPA